VYLVDLIHPFITFSFIGYYAVGAIVTLVTISPLGVTDLSSADLESKKQRVQNIVKIIKLCPILRLLGDIIPPQYEFLPKQRYVPGALPSYSTDCERQTA
jgi:hypothetical protein